MDAIVNSPIQSVDIASLGAVATWKVTRILTDSTSKEPYAYILVIGNLTAKLPAKHTLPGTVEVGDEIEVMTYKVDAFEPDNPELLVSQTLPGASAFLQEHVGKAVEGTVTEVVQFGAFVDVGNGIIGLVYTTALTPKMPEEPEFWEGALRAKEAAHSDLKVGDKVKVVICTFQLQTHPRWSGEFKVVLSGEQVGYSRLRNLLQTKTTPELKIQAMVLGNDQNGHYEIGVFFGAESVVAKLPVVGISCAVKMGDTVRVIVDSVEADDRGRTVVKLHHEDAKNRAGFLYPAAARKGPCGRFREKPGKGSGKK